MICLELSRQDFFFIFRSYFFFSIMLHAMYYSLFFSFHALHLQRYLLNVYKYIGKTQNYFLVRNLDYVTIFPVEIKYYVHVVIFSRDGELDG